MSAPICVFLLTVLYPLFFVLLGRIIKQEDIPLYRKKVTKMFHHAYDGYIQYAYPYDELRPLTCDGHDTWGSYSLTLIDALDMLVIMGNTTEFQRVTQLIIHKMDFNDDINVSVFETNIRVVGGLLSAHLMSKRGGLNLEPGWPCSGPLLRMAEDVARRLLPAFDTPTGMPYGTVNLKYGVPEGETTVTCTAGVGTFLIEFGALSKLTGDPIFEKVAMRAMKSLWNARSTIGLVGNHIDVATGKWTALDAGVGGGVDSYFEYLVKASIMFQNTELLDMFNEYLSSVEKYLKKDDWYMWAHMNKGSISLPIFTSLDCYWPGIQALLGDIDKGMKTIHNFHQVWKQFGFIPEFYNIVKNEAQGGREGYPLRPELIESVMYLYQATKDPYLLEIGVDMLESIEQNTKTRCGYATVKDVTTHTLENRMESFFLAETTKYLYLLFDPDNFIFNTGDHGTVIHTPNGLCVIDTGGYMFNTEAHPIDTAALYCCSAEKKQDDLDLQAFHDNLDLLTLFDITESNNTLMGVKWTKEQNKSQSFVTKEMSDRGNHRMIKDQNLRNDHQQILSTNGQTFKVSSKHSVVTKESTDGTDIVTNVQQNLHDGNKFDTLVQKTDNVGAEQLIESKGADYEDCDKDGDCVIKRGKKNDENKDVKEVKHTDSKYVVLSEDTLKKIVNNVNNAGSKASENVKGETQDNLLNDNKKTSVAITPAIQSCPKKAKGQLGSRKFNDILELVKSFTEEYLANNRVKSVRTLHEKMKYYSLFHKQENSKFVCPAQPFYRRFSLMGEMFLDDL